MLRLAAALTFVLAAASTAWWGPVPRFLIAVVGVLLLVAAALVGLRATWTGLIARGAPVVPPAWLARPLRHARITALVAMAALAVQPLFAPSLLEWCYRIVLAR